MGFCFWNISGIIRLHLFKCVLAFFFDRDSCWSGDQSQLRLLNVIVLSFVFFFRVCVRNLSPFKTSALFCLSSSGCSVSGIICPRLTLWGHCATFWVCFSRFWQRLHLHVTDAHLLVAIWGQMWCQMWFLLLFPPEQNSPVAQFECFFFYCSHLCTADPPLHRLLCGCGFVNGDLLFLMFLSKNISTVLAASRLRGGGLWPFDKWHDRALCPPTSLLHARWHLTNSRN